MRITFHAAYASSRGRSSTRNILRLRLQKLNPAQRRPFDSSTESDCRRRGFLALIRHQNFYRRKSEQRLVPMGEEHMGKRGGFTLLTQLSCCLSFPVLSSSDGISRLKRIEELEKFIYVRSSQIFIF